jgi:hypothetical protein
MAMTTLPSELRTLVQRYGTHVMDDADGFRATLDDFLDQGTNPGEVNLLVDAIRFGSLERLQSLLDQGAEPAAATSLVAGDLVQRRGGDVDSAYWACAVLGYAAGLLAPDLVPGNWERPSSRIPTSDPVVTGAAGPLAEQSIDEASSSDPLAVGDFEAESNPAMNPAPAAAVVPQPVPGNGGGGRPPAAGDLQPTASSKTSRRSLWLLLAGVAMVCALLIGAVVYLEATRDTDDSTSGNEIPLTALEPEVPFGHFGASLPTAMQACADGTIPGGATEWNCQFDEPYEAFNLKLTEQDPQIQEANGVLPDIVSEPPPRTIVTRQPVSETSSFHAYLLQWKENGADGVINTADDLVALTLFDVDPSHPGAAIFTARDSTSAPLTHSKADELLASISPNTEIFPVPAPFQSSTLAGFASDFQSARPDAYDGCIRAFTKFRGETEHVFCEDGNVSVEFGSIDSLNRVRLRYLRGAEVQAWYGDNAKGILATSKYGQNTLLYWQRDDGSEWGLLASSDVDELGLITYFKGISGNPRVQPL